MQRNRKYYKKCMLYLTSVYTKICFFALDWDRVLKLNLYE